MEDFRKARSRLPIIATSTGLLKWSRPPTGKLCLNVDIAHMQGTRRFGVGYVIQDDTGMVMVAIAIPLLNL